MNHYYKLIRSYLFNTCTIATISIACYVTAQSEQETSFFDQGTPSLDLRLRWESAEAGTLETSDALTLRTRVGFLTGTYAHFSAFVEMEDIRLISDEDSVNLAGQNPATAPTHTPIPDPEETEVNRAWLKFDYAPVTVKGGRQRINFDDSRFIGNVGWRQNEQTFDAIRLDSKFGESVALSAVYVGKVQRIFGDNSPAGADFEGDSFLFNLSYTHSKTISVTAFTYLQDLETTTGNYFPGANDTYGIRLQGTAPLSGDSLKLSYQASVATQSESSQAPAGTDFSLEYYWADATLAFEKFSLGGGVEILEGDGVRQFVTPLATVHKFQGWADVFLGASVGGIALGGSGIEDYFLNASTTIPAGNGIKLTAVYHVFESETTSATGFNGRFGYEWDLVAVYPINKHVKLLLKFADYQADNNPMNPTVDTQKAWLQCEVSF